MRLLAAVALVLLLSGCFGVGGGPSGGREVPLEVVSVERVAGRCFDGATAFGEICDKVTVVVDNRDYTNDLGTNTLHWSAETADGRVVEFGDSNADAVAGGREATLVIGFTQDDGAAKLVELRYNSFQGHGRAPIPTY